MRAMQKNIYEVLQQKEADIERLKQELRALRVVAPLLEEELSPEVLEVIPPPMRNSYPTPPANGEPLATATKPIWP
jgi:predicted  nucleic acid-binding Zn-ribbon protein